MVRFLAVFLSVLVLQASVAYAASCSLNNVTEIKNPDRYVWCPGPKSRHIKKVIGAFPHSAFAGGKLSEERVKKVVRGCGITTDLKLFEWNNKKPVFTTKPAPTTDGKCMLIFKGVGGRRLILIN